MPSDNSRFWETRNFAEMPKKRKSMKPQILTRREDPFGYYEMKLRKDAEDMPALQNVDEAMKRRLLVVPFKHRPPRVDLDLEQKLLREAAGILRWMIEGAIDWQENGLVKPESVACATNEYFDDQDLFGQWLSENYRTEPGNDHIRTPTGELFASWTAFATTASEYPGSQKALADRLLSRGFRKTSKSMGGRTTRVWLGITSKQTGGNNG